MAARHSQNRRRAYGRRQHEVRERERVERPGPDDSQPLSINGYEHPDARAIFARIRGEKHGPGLGNMRQLHIPEPDAA